MKSRILLLVCSLLVPALLWGAPEKQNKSKKKSKTTKVATTPEKKVSNYDKLFKDKKCETCKGLITLHKVDESKLYLEIPFSVLGREMLLGSTVSEISNNEHGVIGYKSKDPLHVKFTHLGKGVQLSLVNCVYGAADKPDDAGIAEAVKRSSIDGIYRAFKAEAYNADSTAVVVDATDLFLEDNADLTPFDQYSTYARKPFSRSTSFQKSRSHLGQIKAFEDNVTIKSYLTYTVDVDYNSGKMVGKVESKRAFTALTTRTLMLLPQTQMRPRIADPRMNIFVTGKAKFSANMNRGTMPVYYARHWRLEPKDVEAYRRGELVEPVKPIVFYVDKNFPEAWRPNIKAGILEWNKPLEAIGFKNAVQALDYPENDPEFDPDNLKYSCIRYAPISIQNAMGPSWDDPRSGEIINASVMVYHDIIKLITRWRFLQTAAADPQVRTMNIPKVVMDDALRYVIAHEIGHCLGFMHNMASSAAIPTDSLRSPSFTQKHGTTVSIMDYARFNHVAQPGDGERGVRMTPPNMGVFDYYAVKWLYSPLLDAKTAEEEVPILSKWISEKAGDKTYRYGKQQVYNTLDPSALSEDLGDDLVKSAGYGIKNLKFIMKNMNSWVAKDDKDLSFRESTYMGLLNQYLNFIYQVYNIKGGAYMNERMAGDPRPSYSFVDGDYQRRAQKFLIEQLNDLDWIDDPALLKELPLQGNLSVKMQRLLVSFVLADKGTLGRMIDPAKNAYTIEEHADDAFNGIFQKTIKGQELSPRDRFNQINYVDYMLMISRLDRGTSSSSKSIADDQASQFILTPQLENPMNVMPQSMLAEASASENLLSKFENEETRDQYMGFGWFRSLTESLTPRDPLYYGKVVDTRNLLRKMRYTGSKETQNHYELLLHRIEGAMQ